jgi:hypothetical protein
MPTLAEAIKKFKYPDQLTPEEVRKILVDTAEEILNQKIILKCLRKR